MTDNNAVFDYDKALTALESYYNDTDYFDISKTGGLSSDELLGYYLARKNTSEVVARDELTNLDIMFSNMAQLGETITNIGDRENSNDEESTFESMYNLLIPSTLQTVTDTGKYTLKSAVGALGVLGDTLKTGSLTDIELGDLGVLAMLMCGKKIRSTAYDESPNLWNEQELEKLWGKEWTDQHLLKNNHALLYAGVGTDKKVSHYVDSDLLGALMKRAKEQNMLGYTIQPNKPPTDAEGTIAIHALNINGYLSLGSFISAIAQRAIELEGNFGNKKIVWIMNRTNSNALDFMAYELKDGDHVTVNYSDIISNGLYNTGYIYLSDPITYTEKNISYIISYNYDTGEISYASSSGGRNRYNKVAIYNYFNIATVDYSAYISCVVDYVEKGHDGVESDEAPLPDDAISNDDTASDVINKIINYYKTNTDNPNNQEIYNKYFGDENTIIKRVPQKDGTVKEIKLVKIPDPIIIKDENNQPTSDDRITQEKPNPDISTLPNDLIKKLTDLIGTKTSRTDIPITGDGITPTTPLPIGKASALYKWYNPNDAQLDSFGAYLWSSNFIENVKKLMVDPMSAVIGLKKVYMSPHTSGSATIKVGFLDSGIESNIIDSQYVTKVCGKVDIREYFGNILDYAPYTKISLYLPFIGIVPLNPADVLRSTIQVVYKGDIVNGCCIAEVNVQRDGAGGTVYTYTGNMACEYPLTAGTYTGIISSIFSVAGSAIGGLSSGIGFNPIGVLTGAASSALGSLANGNMFNVQQSGSFSGTAGAMAHKKPYLIISRPQCEMNDNFPALQGYPSNKYVTLSECAGYTRVKAVHVDKISSATQEEKQEIENALTRGVIIR